MDEVGKKTEIDLVAGNKTNGGGAKKGRIRFPSLPSCDLIANWCQMSATRRKFGSSGAAERPVPVYLSRASAFLLLSSWSLLPVELRWAGHPRMEMEAAREMLATHAFTLKSGVELDLELGRQDGRGRARTRDPSKDVLSSVKCIFASVNNKRFVNFFYSTLPTFDFST